MADTYESHKTAAQLEREVEAQRSRVSNTIDEIQGQLSPGQIVDQLMSMTKGGAGDFAQSLGRAVAANPLPVALMGASLVWLMSGKKLGGGHHHESHAYGSSAAYPEGYRYGDSDAYRSEAYASGSNGNGHGNPLGAVKSFASNVAGKVSGAVGGVAGAVGGVAGAVGGIAGKVGGAAGSVGDMTGKLGERAGSAGQHLGGQMSDARDHLGRRIYGARHSAMQAGSNVVHMLEEQPMVAGALAFAVGAAIGAVAPRLRQEDELMGGIADQVKEAVKDVAEPLIEEGKHVLEEGKSRLEEGRSRLGEGLGGIKDKVSSTFSSSGSAGSTGSSGLGTGSSSQFGSTS